MINKKKINQNILLYLAIFIILPIALNWFSLNPTQKASAATFSVMSDSMTRTKAAQLSSHTITFTSTHDLVNTDIVSVDFHEDDGLFTVGGAATVATDIDYTMDGQEATIVGIDNDCTGHIGNNDVVVSVNDTTGVLTLKNCANPTFAMNNNNLVGSAFAVNRVYSIEYGTAATSGGAGANRVTNPSVGSRTIDLAGSWGDSGKLAVVIVAEDQVSVNATVDPSLAFTMTPTTLLFGTLTTANIRYADSTGGLTTIPAQAATPLLTASTNGVSGVLISVYDAGNGTGGLYSSTVSELIPASSVNGLVAGNKKFGVTGLSGSSLTLTPGFSGTSTNGTGTISNIAQSFASSAGPVASGSAGMIMVASIDALTKAGAYTDIVTVVCTGRF